MSGEKLKLSDFQIRLLSGIVLCPLAAVIIIIGGGFFIALMIAAMSIAFHEWYGMIKGDKKKVLYLFLGAAYLGICFASFSLLRIGFAQGAWLSLSAILCVWASDTGAYFVGKKMGAHKLAPQISPNKTWEGLGGAMFFSGAALAILMMLSNLIASIINTDIGLEPKHIAGVFAAGCLLGAVGQAGDLLISIFKRQAGLKDTGHLIPGHGGLLDRIDSLLLVCPTFFVIVSLWMA